MSHNTIHSILNPTMSEMLSNIVGRGGKEYVPLSPTRRVYIEVDDLIERHEKRVEEAFKEWKRKYYSHYRR